MGEERREKRKKRADLELGQNEGEGIEGGKVGGPRPFMGLSRQPTWRDSSAAPESVVRQGGPTLRHASSGQTCTPPWLGFSRQPRWCDQKGWFVQLLFLAISIKILIKNGLKIKKFQS
jgi:hypothetical protein